jgi:hypothetical protein
MPVYVNYWIDALDYFGDVIAYIASDTDGKSTAEVGQLIKDYRETVIQDHDKIFDNAASELKFYMNFYDVRPRHGAPDELKIFYFLGTAIAESFATLGLSDLQVYQLKAVQRIFNKILDQHDAYRADLSKRIDIAIEKGALSTDFGRFGWYIVHRCLLNAAREKKTSK